jgi:hypothetical protein
MLAIRKLSEAYLQLDHTLVALPLFEMGTAKIMKGVSEELTREEQQD